MRITSQSHPDDIKSMEFFRQKALDVLQAAGATKVWAGPVNDARGSAHNRGSCRMAGRRIEEVGLPRGALLAAVLVVGIPSFVLGAVMVSQGDPSAYFVTTTRIWEFGAGALVGLALRRAGHPMGSSAARLTAAYAGWAALLTYMVLFRVEYGFPGVNAVLPVRPARLKPAGADRSSLANASLWRNWSSQ